MSRSVRDFTVLSRAMLVIVLFVRHGLAQINHRQSYKNESLNYCHECAKRHCCDWQTYRKNICERFGDLFVGEIAHRAAQHVDLGAQIVVERRKPGVLHAAIMPAAPDLDEGWADGAAARSAPTDAADDVGARVGP